MSEKITVPMIRSWEPCYDPTNFVGEDWEGTVWDVLEHLDLSIADKFWVVLREELLPVDLLHEFACRCAEDVLQSGYTPKGCIQGSRIGVSYRVPSMRLPTDDTCRGAE